LPIANTVSPTHPAHVAQIHVLELPAGILDLEQRQIGVGGDRDDFDLVVPLLLEPGVRAMEDRGLDERFAGDDVGVGDEVPVGVDQDPGAAAAGRVDQDHGFAEPRDVLLDGGLGRLRGPIQALRLHLGGRLLGGFVRGGAVLADRLDLGSRNSQDVAAQVENDRLFVLADDVRSNLPAGSQDDRFGDAGGNAKGQGNAGGRHRTQECVPLHARPRRTAARLRERAGPAIFVTQ